ncbi:MAG: DUF1631 family protein, partial [Arenimonas sp.]
MTHPQFPIQGRWVYQNDPNLFDTLRKRSVSHLQVVLGRVLGKADDWLFEVAQKEGSVAGSAPLDAMRVLRQSRGTLEVDFTRHFEQGFESLQRQISQAGSDGQVLSLVEADQLEAQLASEVLVESISRAHGPALDAVERRFALMVGVVKLDTGMNPLSASSLANGVRSAQTSVSLPDNLRVVLFKIYERELVASLGELLSELNARMTGAGILPELGSPRPTDEAGPQVSSLPATAPVADGPGDDRDNFDALCALLHSWRPQFGGSAVADARGGATGDSVAAGSRRPLALNEMMSVLSLLQPSVPQAVQEAMANGEASLSQLIKREMLQSASRIGVPPDQVRMSSEHEDAVDLVGMLFDVLLDERDFESQARTLISRCVVPYVKAAVMDRRMFQYKTHPARRLLNSLSEAVEGNKGEGPQEKELLHKAEETVDKLVADFNEDIAIFETL